MNSRLARLARRSLPPLSGLLAVAVLLVGGHASRAAEQVLNVPLGGVKQITTDQPILRLSAGDPEVAEVSPLGKNTVLVKGKRIGSTTVMVWDVAGGEESYVVNVGPDVDSLTATLRQLFPGENISLQGSGSILVLKGTVSSIEVMNSVSQWAEGYQAASGGKVKVINRLDLPTAQQVQLEVKFAEVSRSALRKLGMNLVGKYKGHLGGLFSARSPQVQWDPTGAGKAADMSPEPFLPLGLPYPILDAASILVMSDRGIDFPFNALLSILSARGLAKTLSEPTLVALSGQKAQLLVGGEFPIPIPTGLNQISIEYKSFGIELAFMPIVLNDRTVQLHMTTGVSDLDFANALKLSGATVPTLTTRRSDTTVRLRSGQSFAVAGLLSDRIRSAVEKIPLLGDIPILGMLFRSQDFQREETELVVVVTVRLVEPVEAEKMPLLPGEGELSDPSDLEFFLLGWGDLERTDPEARKPGYPAGPVGYKE